MLVTDEPCDGSDRQPQSSEEFRFRYYSSIMAERGKEIRFRIKTTSILLVDIIVISIALLEAALVHVPASLLLALPALLFYFYT